MYLSLVILLSVPFCQAEVRDLGIPKYGKFFSPFNVIIFNNGQCTTADGDTGICRTAAECASLPGGTASGNCALGFGVCCGTFRSECGGSVDTNCTYIISPDYPASTSTPMSCQWTVRKVAPDVCFIRLDYDQFSIAGPVIDATSLGNCDMDVVTFDDGSQSGLPAVCGENTGQHFYYDIGPGSSLSPTLMISLVLRGTAFNRLWKIKVVQTRCGQFESPPQGCGVYLTGHSGVVKSFNFAATTEFRHLNSQEYSVCVRQEVGFCSLMWYPTSDPLAFKLSMTIGATARARTGSKICAVDYVMIPGGFNPGGQCSARQGFPGGTVLLLGLPSVDRYCGSFLNCIDFSIKHNAVQTSSFMLHVNFNAIDNSTPNDNRGFSLMYTQLPCN